MKFDEEQSHIEVINRKLQILNFNEFDKNIVELVNENSQIRIKAENNCLNANSESSDEPYMYSSMSCQLEIKYTNPIARGEYLCRTMKRNFFVKFFQIITLKGLNIEDLK